MTQITKSQEKELIKKKEIIVRRRFLYFIMYMPEPLLKWLNIMQLKGYRLYKVTNRMFYKFYFIKSDVKDSYGVDFAFKFDDAYYNHHKECGWNLLFTSSFKQSGFSIWSKPIINNHEEKFYSDVETLARLNRRNLFLVIGLFLSFFTLSLIMLAIDQSFTTCLTLTLIYAVSFAIYYIANIRFVKIVNSTFSKYLRLLIKYSLLFFVGFTTIFVTTALFTSKEVLVDGELVTEILSKNLLVNTIQFNLLMISIISFCFLFVSIIRYLSFAISNKRI